MEFFSPAAVYLRGAIPDMWGEAVQRRWSVTRPGDVREAAERWARHADAMDVGKNHLEWAVLEAQSQSVDDWKQVQILSGRRFP